jgi:predicted DNA-binding WGR domain protein
MSSLAHVDLFYQSGGSDKEYHIQIVPASLNDGAPVYRVETSWGRRGSAAATGNLGIFTTLDKAQKALDKKLREQRLKGYQTPEELGMTLAEIYAATDIHAGSDNTPVQAPVSQPAASISTRIVKRRILWDNPDAEAPSPAAPVVQEPAPDMFGETGIVIAQLLNEIMDESAVGAYLLDPAWGLQEKKDGKHLTVKWWTAPNTPYQISTINKKGKLIASAPAFINAIRPCLVDKVSMLLDGEQIGNDYFVYDILEYNGRDLRGLSYERRYDKLCNLFPIINPHGIIRVRLYIYTEASLSDYNKSQKYQEFKNAGLEGVVFKRLAATFTPGKAHQDMWKWKFYATCSCRVSNRETGKHSIGLELLDIDALANTWRDVGNCTIGQNQPLPSPGSIAEIKYLYAYRHGCLYQPSYIGPRDDVDESECTTNQLKYKAGT